MIDPKGMINLTFSTRLQVLTDHCPTFSLYKSRSVFSTVQKVFETFVRCVLGVGHTGMNSLLGSPPLFSLPLDFVGSKWLNLVCLGRMEPDALAPCAPGP